MQLRQALSPALVALVSSCQVVREFKYSPPSPATRLSNERVVSASFNETWKALIANIGKQYFAIDGFEKESGLITLKFSTSPFSDAVSGGHCLFRYDNSAAVSGQFWATGVSGQKTQLNFDGDYADYVEQFLNGQFEGRMNLVVAELDPKKTKITVNARFVVTAVAPNRMTGAVERTTWAWNSGELCRKYVTTAEGAREPRIMRSANQVETQLLDTIDNLFNAPTK